MSNVVLFTEQKKYCDKLEAHKLGLKHYAFSVMVFNTKGEILLQQRAFSKYHSGGLWSNACCGHPLTVASTFSIQCEAQQRLFEEMGFTTDIHYKFTCEYSFKCSDLIENEVDYVFEGLYTKEYSHPNKDEVNRYKWISVESLIDDIRNNSDSYTLWFKYIMNRYHF